MTQPEIQPYLDADPFEPFTIVMPHGSSYEVTRRDGVSFSSPTALRLHTESGGWRATLAVYHIVSIIPVATPTVIGGRVVTEDEAFIRTIVDRPGDDLPRLVYADWLDERNDPRGAYLRAELAIMNGPRTKRGTVPSAGVKRVRKLGAKLDGIWTARVSRPPVGVCCNHLRFEGKKGITQVELSQLQVQIGHPLPPMYAAFRLNHAGELRLPDEIERDEFGTAGEPFGDYPLFNDRHLGVLTVGADARHLGVLPVGDSCLYNFATQTRSDSGTYYLMIGLSPAVVGRVYQADHEEDFDFGDLSRLSEMWEGEYANYDSPDAFLASLFHHDTLAEYLASLIPFDTPLPEDE